MSSRAVRQFLSQPPRLCYLVIEVLKNEYTLPQQKSVEVVCRVMHNTQWPMDINGPVPPEFGGTCPGGGCCAGSWGCNGPPTQALNSLPPAWVLGEDGGAATSLVLAQEGSARKQQQLDITEGARGGQGSRCNMIRSLAGREEAPASFLYPRQLKLNPASPPYPRTKLSLRVLGWS